MAELKRIFLRGSMNKDLDERMVADGQYRDALNINVVDAEGEDAGSARNHLGNAQIGSLSDTAGQAVNNARTIGAVAYEAENLIYYIVASDNFDGIYEYSEITNGISRVLQSNKVNPSTASKFNFDQDFYITGFNYIDGFLYWTDNNNAPRKIKIDRAKSYNIDDDRINDDITVIITAPIYAPTIDMQDTQNQENNMEEKFLEFSYRWITVDDQYTPMAPFSGVAFTPGSYALDYGSGENKAMLNTKNRVKVTFRTGNRFVTGVELLVRDSSTTNIAVVESFNKDQLGILNDSVWSFDFANSKKYRPIASNQKGRLSDYVPLKAKSQEIIDRRLIYGDYVQHYDIKDNNSLDILIDYNVDFVYKPTLIYSPIQTFRSDRDLEIGIEYGDEYGRLTTVLTSENNTVYIPPENSVTGNSLKIDIINKPPEFATNYRLVIKQTRGKYYNIFPILYYADGTYRYFLINDFDLDKFAVGDYVIFKSDLEGATLSNKKYKVLELENKAVDFISSTSSPELAGLYFKIKVDSSFEFNPAALFSYDFEGYGANNLSGGQFLAPPVHDRFSVAENPIHYGSGIANVLSVIGNAFSGPADLRITIEIVSQTTFRYTSAVGGSSSWTTASISSGSTPINVGGITAINIQWSLGGSPFVVGDKWKINCRTSFDFGGNIFGGNGLPGQWSTAGTTGIYDWGGAVILPGPGWSPTISPETDRAIEAGAVIGIEILTDTYNAGQPTAIQYFPPSTVDYVNIEEWFIESGAYQAFVHMVGDPLDPTNPLAATDVGAKGVTFRRGSNYLTSFLPSMSLGVVGAGVMSQGSSITSETLNYPVRMIIQGFQTVAASDFNVVQASISVQQAEFLAICETVPPEADADIYHETSRTYPISGGEHKVLWAYQDFTTPTYASPAPTGYTNLGQLIPGDTPSGIDPHTFQVGDQVEVHTSASPYASIPGMHTVLWVEDKYNIIIDLIFPGNGAATGGTIGFYHDQTEEKDQVIVGNNCITPATLLINPVTNTNSTFNAYAFGTGLETDRIRDNFNSTTLEYSPRVSTVIEDYKQENRIASLTYSGLYKSESSINNLNEFNLSLQNYKNLDPEYGSIQKLFSRDNDLVVMQEDKISRVLYGKNLLSDAVGGGTITSVPQVLGTQIPDKGEWGISYNPESFAKWGDSFYFTDARRGTVLNMSGETIVSISKLGMKSYFRDLMRGSLNTQKLGVYDPYNGHYILASNANTSKPCRLTLSRPGGTYSADQNPNIEFVGNDKPDFSVYSNTSWTVGIVYSAGSGWVTGWPTSGVGDEGVFLGVSDNNTAVTRTATITFTFCGGLTATYIVTQGPGKVIIVKPWVLTTISKI